MDLYLFYLWGANSYHSFHNVAAVVFGCLIFSSLSMGRLRVPSFLQIYKGLFWSHPYPQFSFLHLYASNIRLCERSAVPCICFFGVGRGIVGANLSLQRLTLLFFSEFHSSFSYSQLQAPFFTFLIVLWCFNSNISFNPNIHFQGNI